MRFAFKLKGKDWFGLYLAVLMVYAVPNIAMHFLSAHMRAEPRNLSNLFYFFLLFAFMMAALLVLVVPVLTRIFASVRLDNEPFGYKGTIGGFVLLNIGNILLSIVTLGIFYPWYIRNVLRHISSNLEYKGSRFGFGGKGLHLFAILLLTGILPLIAWGAWYAYMMKAFQASVPLRIVSLAVIYVVLVPYFYLYYKWMIHITYKGFTVEWNTAAGPSMLTILAQVLLTLVTAGIYFPIAIAKLYDYFVNRTVISRDGAATHSLRVKLEYFHVWKVTWAQVLLTLVSLGVYGAWAYCRIAALYVDATSIESPTHIHVEG